MKIIENEMVADKGHYISRKGSDSYYVRCTLLDGETKENFVEITSAKYDKIIAEREKNFINE